MRAFLALPVFLVSLALAMTLAVPFLVLFVVFAVCVNVAAWSWRVVKGAKHG